MKHKEISRRICVSYYAQAEGCFLGHMLFCLSVLVFLFYSRPIRVSLRTYEDSFLFASAVVTAEAGDTALPVTATAPRRAALTVPKASERVDGDPPIAPDPDASAMLVNLQVTKRTALGV